jgi:hypothetical protein
MDVRDGWMMDVRDGWMRQLKQGRFRSICGAVKLSGDGLGTCWTGLDHKRDWTRLAKSWPKRG